MTSRREDLFWLALILVALVVGYIVAHRLFRAR